MEGCCIGTNCNIGDYCFIESGAVIGDNVTIKNGNMIWEGITLENGVFVGPQVSFTNDLFPRSPRLFQAEKRYGGRGWLLPTLVRRGASLGAGAVILPGITVGEFCMVAAGAVVTKDTRPYALLQGVPAREQRWVCQCGQPLTFQGKMATCSECKLSFVANGNLIAPVHVDETTDDDHSK